MKNMIKIIKGLLVAAIISAFSFAAYAADSKKPTRIPVHNWSSQIVMAYVTVSYTHLTLPTKRIV